MIGFGVPDCRPPAPALPFALLRHALPDGTHHFDLLLATGHAVPDEAREVPTWRCDRDPCTLPIGGEAALQRIAPHRGLYLRLSEPRALGGERGQVTPVRRGTHASSDGHLVLHAVEAHWFQMQGDRLRRVPPPIT